MKMTKIKMWGQRVHAYYQDGMVYVYDSVAGHYTTCHSASVGQVKYVKGRASK